MSKSQIVYVTIAYYVFPGLNLRRNSDSKEETKDEPYEHVDKSKRDPNFIGGKLNQSIDIVVFDYATLIT